MLPDHAESIQVSMLKQTALIEVQDWVPDPLFAVFPQGARAKDAIFSPSAPSDPCITPDKRYLFKKSKKSYPDQFWGEVIAYRVGCAIGIEVPPAFVACNSTTGVCAALIEWFYIDTEEVSILAGDLLTRIQPNFDRKKGTSHNLKDATTLMRGFLGTRGTDRMGVNWKQWWTNTLFFDALIGNTDRHQDNWTLLFKLGEFENLPSITRIGPCFDNGTSLGHERFAERVANWDTGAFERYVDKGTHHVKWSLEEPVLNGHFALLSSALASWPETRNCCIEIAQALSIDRLKEELADLLLLDCAIPLTPQRYDFVIKLLSHRIDRLKAMLLT